MRTIAHLSDLHFGRLDRAIPPALIAAIDAAEPDVVVLSGDLTQRARRREFDDAREFLDDLPSPQIVVPGNHDVPLYNVVARTLTPLARYRRTI
ncbi:MAG: metallophosphoesterase, partial [Roseiarcus sp.]